MGGLGGVPAHSQIIELVDPVVVDPNSTECLVRELLSLQNDRLWPLADCQIQVFLMIERPLLMKADIHKVKSVSRRIVLAD